MNDEFGAGYSAVIQADLVLSEFNDRTAVQLIAAGEDLRAVWFAICRANNVPQNRWNGIEKPKRTEQNHE